MIWQMMMALLHSNGQLRAEKDEMLSKSRLLTTIINVIIRDVRNRFFNFGSVSVRFLKKTRIRFRMNLVRFGLQKLGSVRIVIYY